MRLKLRWKIILYIVIALMGCLLILWFTRNGRGVTGDAVHYMDGARNLLAGRGYSRSVGDGTTKPITGFPPAFSGAIALFTLFIRDVLQAGRWLNALLFGVNIWLMGWLSYRLTKSWIVGLLASLFALAFRDAILSHAWVMSEALYIALTLVGFLLLSMYWERQRRRWLVLAGLAAGLSVLTRYVGLALVGAVGLGLLLFGQPGWKRRLGDAFWFGVCSLLPFLAWLGRNALLAGNLTARQTSYHVISRDMLVAFFDEISSWFVPNDLHFAWWPRLITFVLFCLVGLVLFAWEWWRSRQAVEPRDIQVLHLHSVMAIFMAAYLAIVFVNLLTLDATTSLAGLRRYLLPIYFVLVLWLLSVFARALQPRLLRVGAGVIAILLLSVYVWGAVNFIRSSKYVLGYTDVRNLAPDLIMALHAIEPERPLLSNNYEAVYFLADRPPYGLPNIRDQFTGDDLQAEKEYQLEMQKVRQLLEQGGVLVAYDAKGDPTVEALTPMLIQWQNFGKIIFYVHPDSIP